MWLLRGQVRSSLSSKGRVVLYAMCEFWLCQNPPEVLLQADTLTPQQVRPLRACLRARARPLPRLTS